MISYSTKYKSNLQIIVNVTMKNVNFLILNWNYINTNRFLTLSCVAFRVGFSVFVLVDLWSNYLQPECWFFYFSIIVSEFYKWLMSHFIITPLEASIIYFHLCGRILYFPFLRNLFTAALNWKRKVWGEDFNIIFQRPLLMIYL